MRTPPAEASSTRLLYHDPAAPAAPAGAESPFRRAILDLLSAGGGIDLACPYIGLNYLDPLLARADRWRLLTDAEAMLSICAGLTARRRMAAWVQANRGRVRHVAGLHAKVVIGPGRALVGSTNLTDAGTLRRVEVGASLTGAAEVGELRRWFQAVWDRAAEPDPSAMLALAAVGDPPPPRGGRPAGFGESPVRAAPAAGEPPRGRRSVARTVEDGEPAAKPARSARAVPNGGFPFTVPLRDVPEADALAAVAATLRARADREWAETFFDWLADLIRLTGLPEGDRQLTVTLTSPDRSRDIYRSIGANVNNRTALAFSDQFPLGRPTVIHLVGRSFADKAQNSFSDLVRQTHVLRGKVADDPPALLWTAFPPPAELLAAGLRDEWEREVAREVRRTRGHSPAGGRAHLPLLYRAAIDLAARRTLFDSAFGGGGP